MQRNLSLFIQCFISTEIFFSLVQDAFGFIERADVVKEIFFHYSEFKGDLEALQAGDDVEFSIKDRNVGFVRDFTNSFFLPLGADYLEPLQSVALNS